MSATKNESISSNLCSVLNYSIPPFLSGAAVLMGNQSSNKAADCRSIQTLLLWFPSLRDTNVQSPVMYVKIILWILLFISVQEGEHFTFVLLLLYIWVLLRQLYIDPHDRVSVYAVLLERACRDACLSPALFVFFYTKSKLIVCKQSQTLFVLQCPCRRTGIIMRKKYTRIHSLWTAQPQRVSKVDMSPTHR